MRGRGTRTLVAVATVGFVLAACGGGKSGTKAKGSTKARFSSVREAAEACIHPTDPIDGCYGAVGQAKGDFNNDGFADLAVGAPNAPIGNHIVAGAVSVLYGSATGLNTSNHQLLTQDTPGLPGDPGDYDGFGAAVASADFNGDGFSDLAATVPAEPVNGLTGAGAVQIVYGSGAVGGLDPNHNQLITQADPGIPGDPVAFGRWPGTLAWGEFGRGPEADLAIGSPGTTVNGHRAAGTVTVLYGSPTGLTADGAQLLTEDTFRLGQTSADGEGFGLHLAGGDLNHDKFSELAIAAPNEDVVDAAGVTQHAAGQVTVLFGSTNGLTTDAHQVWNQASSHVGDSPERLDLFGSALAIGDLNGDGVGDLAIGVDHEDLSIPDAGAVHVLYGTATTGLTATGAQFIAGDKFNGGQQQNASGFGSVLTTGDLNGDRFAELIAGRPKQGVVTCGTGGATPVTGSGAVNIFPGGAAGLDLSPSTLQTFLVERLCGNPLPGELPFAEANDAFGSSLSAWNFGKGTQADLAIGIPGKPLHTASGTTQNVGIAAVLYGTATGITPEGITRIDAPAVGIADAENTFFPNALY